jgi:hypothetical protein
MLHSLGANSATFGHQAAWMLMVTFLRPTLEYGMTPLPPSARQFARLETAHHRLAALTLGFAHTTARLAVPHYLGLPYMAKRWTEIRD